MNLDLALQKATLAARQRTGDPAISVATKAGEFQLQRITYQPGSPRPDIEPLSPWLPPEEVIIRLDRMGTNPTPEALTAKYAELLRAEIGDSNYRTVLATNAAVARATDYCSDAAHDYCDANMIMLAAYATLTGQAEEDIVLGIDCPFIRLANTAWLLFLAYPAEAPLPPTPENFARVRAKHPTATILNDSINAGTFKF